MEAEYRFHDSLTKHSLLAGVYHELKLRHKRYVNPSDTQPLGFYSTCGQCRWGVFLRDQV